MWVVSASIIALTQTHNRNYQPDDCLLPSSASSWVHLLVRVIELIVREHHHKQTCSSASIVASKLIVCEHRGKVIIVASKRAHLRASSQSNWLFARSASPSIFEIIHATSLQMNFSYCAIMILIAVSRDLSQSSLQMNVDCLCTLTRSNYCIRVTLSQWNNSFASIIPTKSRQRDYHCNWVEM